MTKKSYIFFGVAFLLLIVSVFSSKGSKVAQTLGGGLYQLGWGVETTQVNTLASSTIFIAPKVDGASQNTYDRVFATTSRRSFARLYATTTVGIYVTLFDMPCDSSNAPVNAPYYLSASSSQTIGQQAVEFTVNNPYLGSIRVCGVGSTSSVVATQGTY